MAGPIDAREIPGGQIRLPRAHRDWFERTSSPAPWPYPGVMRMVYPVFALSAFMGQNFARHITAHAIFL